MGKANPGIAALVALLTCVAAVGSEIGQQVASRINADTYRYYLDGRLYTHDGDNRDADCWWGLGLQHDLARENIVAALVNCGLDVELEEVGTGGQYYNVVATQLGTLYPDTYYVVGAHYDSAGTPGADDNASGVAGVLEIARVLSLYQTDYTIKYIAFDQEECGLLGSDAYVQAHATDQILGMVSLDMIAWYCHQWGCRIYGRVQSDGLKTALANAITAYGNELYAQVNSGWDCSDHAPFEWAGFQACLLTEAVDGWQCGGNPCYHEDCDSVDSYVMEGYEEQPYITYDYAADIVRSMAGFLADQAGAQQRFDCASGAGCEPGEGNPDCNGNGLGDLCDIFCGTATDCDGNHVPDECEPDCNGNGVADDCDIVSGVSGDFNHNGIPDECEPHRTIYVDDDAPSDPGPGDPGISDPLEDGSAEHPYDGIQEAIDASISGDTVLVRDGLYTGIGNRSLDFNGRTITVASETSAQACIIDCEQVCRAFYFHRRETAAAVLTGFTIRNGVAAGELPDESFGYGGGVCCYHASPTIANCVITQNSAAFSGAGVSTMEASPVIRDCRISDNVADSIAVYCYHGSPSIVGCTITNNGYGIDYLYTSARLVNCALSDNAGCGVLLGQDSTAVNCTIARNTQCGVYCEDNSTVVNCIVWDNGAANIEVTGSPSVTYCDVGGSWPGTGNIDADPLFVAADQGDYHLRGNSPCIDAGDNYAVPPGVDTDLDGLPRFMDSPGTPDTGQGDPPLVDLGAYECVWRDCNSNGVADDADIAAGTSQDCNANRVPDECDIAGGTSADCTGNGIPDECEPDCNGNGVADSCDIAAGTSQDCSLNGIPDECEPDCNGNGVADSCDIAAGTSPDCNSDGIPDECELELSVAFAFDSDPGWSAQGQWAFGQPTGGGSHNHDPLIGHTGSFVYGCNLDGDYANNASASYLITAPIDCTGMSNVELRFWRWLGVQAAPYDRASIGVSYNGSFWITVWMNSSADIADEAWTQQTVDISWIADGRPTLYVRWGMGPTDATVTYPGWNIDDVELRGTGDCNGNSVPDVCDSPVDCNANGRPDVCDILAAFSSDCNGNEVPDECDLMNGTSSDVNGNGVLDECESVGDLNCDGVTDFGDINPFVLFLSNYAAWQTTFPGCAPLNGDINGDGTYGQWALDDINPFVFLLEEK